MLIVVLSTQHSNKVGLSKWKNTSQDLYATTSDSVECDVYVDKTLQKVITKKSKRIKPKKEK